MKIVLHGKPFDVTTRPYIDELLSDLRRRELQIIISPSFLHILQEADFEVAGFEELLAQEMIADAGFVLSIGGDGTLLETVAMVGSFEVPILGINTGRLGFMATIPKNQISESLQMLFEKGYQLDERTLLTLETDTPLFGDQNFALNEFAIMKRDTSSMITVKTFIDGEFLNYYWSDGLIVSTPTGSTGYSLSCGGPVVLPHSNNFVITPVCPHNLNVRPMVVSDNAIISFEIKGRGKTFLSSLDSRSETVDASVQMAVRKAHFKAKLIQIDGYNFLNTLRQKLNWGLDMRN